eukprot:Gb_17242 [translate_table: standard]
MGISSCTVTLEVTTCVDMPPVVSQTHDSMTSPLGLEEHDLVTSPLCLEPTSIDGYFVIGRRYWKTNKDPKDGDRIQCLRHEIDVGDIVPPKIISLVSVRA